MKKIVWVVLVLVLTLVVFTGCSINKDLELTAKEGEPANGFLWEHNYSEITITGYVGASNDVVIPEKINGKPVTLVAEDAFYNFSGMTSLKIPGSVKKIDHAFRNCSSLKTVELSEGLESMVGAFKGCSRLESIVIPNGIKVLDGTFIGCTSLETLNLPNSYKDRVSITGLTSLKKITMSEESLDLSLEKRGSKFGFIVYNSFTYDGDGNLVEYETYNDQVEVNGKMVDVILNWRD